MNLFNISTYPIQSQRREFKYWRMSKNFDDYLKILGLTYKESNHRTKWALCSDEEDDYKERNVFGLKLD